MSENPFAAQSLHYATATPRPPRLAAGVWVALIGLVLIVFGGCFMIGIMETVRPTFGCNTAPTLMTPRIVTFLAVMYIAAFGCFGGAALLVFKGVKSLYALLNA